MDLGARSLFAVRAMKSGKDTSTKRINSRHIWRGGLMVERYRKVQVDIWGDMKFRALTDDTQLLFLWILTHPHMTSLGAMPGNRMTLAGQRKRWKPERVSKAFQEALGKGLIKADEEACIIVAPNFIKHNKPQSPKVIAGWQTVLHTLPECPVLVEYLTEVKALMEAYGEAYAKAFRIACGKAMAIQEQEQEQETEQEKPPMSETGSDAPDNGKEDSVSKMRETIATAIDMNLFEDFWNLYGMKLNRAKATVAWRKALTGGIKGVEKTFPDVILAAVRDQLTWPDKGLRADNEFKQHPTTWLNSGGWLNERPIKPKPPKRTYQEQGHSPMDPAITAELEQHRREQAEA